MSRAARRRGTHRRIQPYAWLGAGAVTLGMGAAMVGGVAVAYADSGGESTGSTTSHADASSPVSSQSEPSRTLKRATRPSRGPAVTDSTPESAGQAPSGGREGRVSAAPSAAPEIPEVTPAAAVQSETTSAEANTPLPVADIPTAPSDQASTVTPKRATRTAAARVTTQSALDPAPPVDQSPAEVAPAAAVVDPVAPLSGVSWLPGGTCSDAGYCPPGPVPNPGSQIVPGAHVQLALQEIAEAQGILTAQTWGSGNIFAGVAAIVPQVFLASASLSLSAWGATNPGAQDFLAGVAGVPIVQQVAQLTLLGTMVLPGIAEASLGGAALLLPLVNLFGADVTAAQAQVAAARQDGKVYAVIPIRTVQRTQPMVGASLNGGSNASLLIDTGASGLVTTRDKVGGTLGEPIGSGNSSFSGGLDYHYETYLVTVDLGGGAVTTTPVNIVTDNEDYPNSVADFKQFFAWGADGILGVGANAAGPGPSAIPTALMPGELSNGVLIFQNFLPLGLLGFMVLGPNPLPTRVSVPGAPNSYVQVSVNGGPKNDAGAIIDSGGVFGTLNRDLYNPAYVGTNLPSGTEIAVYTADGSTLLYTYTTQPLQNTTVIDSGLFNTGNAPFAQGPIYINYGYDNPYGIGSTDFSIW